MTPMLAFVVEVTLKSSVVLCLAGSGALLLRGATAAVRHAVWSGALAAIVLVPMVSLAGPRLRIVPAGATVFGAAADRVPQSGGAAVERGSSSVGVVVGTVRRDASEVAAAPDRQASRRPAGGTASRVMDLWVLLWLGGALGVLAWMLAGELSLIRLARRSSPVLSGPWATTLGVLRREGRVPGGVRVLESDRAIVPLTYGVLRPLVLLPSAGAAWSAEHRRDVLLHELAHVRRRDGLTHAVARVACVLHWHNPLAWLALRRTRVEREHACDDAVLESGSSASSYAGSLLATARSMRAPRVLASAGLAATSGSALGDRLRAILDAGRRRSRPHPALTGVLLASSLALALPLAALAPGGEAAAPGKPDPEPAVPVATSPRARQARQICPDASDGRERTVRLTGSMSITGRGTAWNGADRWVVWTGADCSVVIHVTGEPRFDASESDVSSLPAGTRFEIRHSEGRTERLYEVRPDGSALLRRYTVDGRDAPMDGAFETWRATLILEFIRRSGWDAEARTLRILDRGGVRGVLDEVGYLESDRVAGTYLRTLLASGRVGEGDIARVLETTGTRIESDRETGRVLAAVPSSLLGTDAGWRAFESVVVGIESDREKAKAIGSLLESGTLGVAHVSELLVAARTIESDRELANLLVGLAERDVPTGSDGAYVAAARTIESDREKARVLAALLDRGPRAAETVKIALGEARTIASDRELGRFLTGLVERGLVTDEVRPAFDAAVETIESERERNRVLAALGRRTI